MRGWGTCRQRGRHLWRRACGVSIVAAQHCDVGATRKRKRRERKKKGAQRKRASGLWSLETRPRSTRKARLKAIAKDGDKNWNSRLSDTPRHHEHYSYHSYPPHNTGSGARTSAPSTDIRARKARLVTNARNLGDINQNIQKCMHKTREECDYVR